MKNYQKEIFSRIFLRKISRKIDAILYTDERITKTFGDDDAMKNEIWYHNSNLNELGR